MVVDLSSVEVGQGKARVMGYFQELEKEEFRVASSSSSSRNQYLAVREVGHPRR